MDKGVFPGQGTSVLTPGSRGPKSVNEEGMGRQVVWSNSERTVGKLPWPGKTPLSRGYEEFSENLKISRNPQNFRKNFVPRPLPPQKKIHFPYTNYLRTSSNVIFDLCFCFMLNFWNMIQPFWPPFHELRNLEIRIKGIWIVEENCEIYDTLKHPKMEYFENYLKVRKSEWLFFDHWWRKI